jgi:hypothetical protein
MLMFAVVILVPVFPMDHIVCFHIAGGGGGGVGKEGGPGNFSA